MAIETYTITLGDGTTYTLNNHFIADKYTPGVASPAGVLRRDEQRTQGRSSDKLLAPDVYRIRGRIWTDDRTVTGYNAMRAEAEDIQNAALTAIKMTRQHEAAAYTLDELQGGVAYFTWVDGFEAEVEVILYPGSSTVDTSLPAPVEPTVFSFFWDINNADHETGLYTVTFLEVTQHQENSADQADKVDHVVNHLDDDPSGPNTLNALIGANRGFLNLNDAGIGPALELATNDFYTGGYPRRGANTGQDSSEFECFFIVRHDGVTETQHDLIHWRTDSSSGYHFEFWYDALNQKVVVEYGADAGNGIQAEISVDLSGGFHAVGAYVDSIGSGEYNIYAYADGVISAATQVDFENAGSSSYRTFSSVAGGFNFGESTAIPGYAKCVGAIQGAHLTTQQRLDMFDWAQTAYGTP